MSTEKGDNDEWIVVEQKKKTSTAPKSISREVKAVKILTRNSKQEETQSKPKQLLQQSQQSQQPQIHIKSQSSTYAQIFRRGVGNQQQQQQKESSLTEKRKKEEDSSQSFAPRPIPLLPETTETKEKSIKPAQILEIEKKKEKKGPQRTIALFDVLLFSKSKGGAVSAPLLRKPSTSTTTTTTTSTTVQVKSPSQEAPPPPSNDSKRNELTANISASSQNPPQNGKKRTKSFSSFKKRILKERLKVHIQRQVQAKIEQHRKLKEQSEVNNTVSNHEQRDMKRTSSVSSSIRIYNFANDINWKDESEKDEIIINIKDVFTMIFENHHQQRMLALHPITVSSTSSPAQSIGTVFHLISSFSVWKWKGSLPSSKGSSNGNDESDGFVTITFIDVKFKQPDIAQSYYQILNGMVIGGEPLKVFYCEEDHGEYVNLQLQSRLVKPLVDVSVTTAPASTARLQNPETEIHSSVIASEATASGSYCVVLENLIQDEDEIKESEDVHEILHDIYSLCESINFEQDLTASKPHHLSPNSLWMERICLPSTSRQRKREQRSSTSFSSPTFLLLKIGSCKDARFILEKYRNPSFQSIYSIDSRKGDVFSSEDDASILRLPSSSLFDVKDLESRYSIGLLNFLSDEEYQDHDERQEIIENIHSIFESLPELADIRHSLEIEKALFVMHANTNDSEDDPGNSMLSIYLFFTEIPFDHVIRLFQSLQDVTISGQSLQVEIVRTKTARGCFYLINELEDQALLSFDSFILHTCLIIQQNGMQFLAFPIEETVLAGLAHEQIVDAKLKLLKSLQKQCGEITSLQKVSILTLQDEEEPTDEQFYSKDFREMKEDIVYRICLQYDRWISSVEAMIYFDGLLLGGSKVTAFMNTDYLHDSSLNTGHHPNHSQSESEERIIVYEYKNELNTLTCTPAQAIDAKEQKLTPLPATLPERKEEETHFHFDLQHWQSYFECVYFEFFYFPTDPSSILSPPSLENVEEEEEQQEPSSPEKPTANKRRKKKSKAHHENVLHGKSEENDKHEKKNDVPDLVELVKSGKTIYPTAKTLQKIGFHEQPMDPTITVANEEINTIIKEFLTALSSLQIKLKEEHPSKWKQRSRYVVGMKQVTDILHRMIEFPHLIQTQSIPRCRLVLIAPNTEKNEEVDTKLQEIIESAKKLEIPIIYCLSKRLLGKALQMTIKQVVVGIIDANGVNELFRKIVHFIQNQTSR